MIELSFTVLIIVLGIACEGFFSGSETALVSVDKMRLRIEAGKGLKKAVLLSRLLDQPEKFLSTTLLGTNIMVVLSNTLATFLVIKYLGARYEYLTIVLMFPLVIVFGEIVPKTIYRYHADLLVQYIAYPIQTISRIFAPLIFILEGITKLFVNILGLGGKTGFPLLTKEDLEHYLEVWQGGGTLKSAEKKMVDRILDFSETTVDAIMIPLVLTQAVEVNDPIDKVEKLIIKTGYSRIPVYDEKMYNIVGIVHALDLLLAKKNHESLKKIVRPARYVPDSLLIDDLLLELKKEGSTMAVVVDEYGGTVGIITIEDILEEVVGEIRDEYDKERRWFAKIGEKKFLVNARMEIESVNEQFHLDLPKEDYETLGGFLLKRMGKIPEKGERLQYHNIHFIIERSDRRSIKEVIIVKPETDQDVDDRSS